MRLKISAFIVLLVMGLGRVVTESSPFDEKQNQEVKRLSKYGEVLDLSISTDKTVYKLNDRLKLQALLTNTSKDTLYIYAILSWGYSASLTLHVSDSLGRGVQAKHFDDSITPLPPPNDRNAFVRLYPQHFLGTYYYSSIDELNLNKPGEYTLFVEYHSPISAAGVQLKPFWGRENGTIRSKPVRIKVDN